MEASPTAFKAKVSNERNSTTRFGWREINLRGVVREDSFVPWPWRSSRKCPKISPVKPLRSNGWPLYRNWRQSLFPADGPKSNFAGGNSFLSSHSCQTENFSQQFNNGKIGEESFHSRWEKEERRVHWVRRYPVIPPTLYENPSKGNAYPHSSHLWRRGFPFLMHGSESSWFGWSNWYHFSWNKLKRMRSENYQDLSAADNAMIYSIIPTIKRL